MIRINDISKTYEKGKVKALQHITISITQGELFGLIGPDGAGKTSLLRIIASLLIQDSGTVHVFEHDTLKNYQAVRNIIGYMPGRFSLYQDLSIEENLQFFANVFNVSIEQNYHLIKELYEQIAPFKDRRAGKLSGGMKQKLALCCALIHEPKLLLLDEPTTGVDPVSRKEFWDMLLRLKQKGITIIVSTPYMDEASLCDRIALIQNGKILDAGSPDEICEKHTEHLFELSGADQLQIMKVIKSYVDTISCFAFGSNLHVTLKTPNINAFTEYLALHGFHNLRIQSIPATIEDVFMHKLATL